MQRVRFGWDVGRRDANPETEHECCPGFGCRAGVSKLGALLFRSQLSSNGYDIYLNPTSM